MLADRKNRSKPGVATHCKSLFSKKPENKSSTIESSLQAVSGTASFLRIIPCGGIARALSRTKRLFPYGIARPPNAGYSAVEMDQSPYLRFFSPQMRPLPDHVQQAVLVGGVSGELIPRFDTASTLLHADDWLLENG
jgi:hypothetical protein